MSVPILTGKQVQPVPTTWMELLSNFEASWGRADGPAFGLHCSRCGQDVEAHNGLTDEVLRVSCACREYASDRYAIPVPVSHA